VRWIVHIDGEYVRRGMGSVCGLGWSPRRIPPPACYSPSVGWGWGCGGDAS